MNSAEERPNARPPWSLTAAAIFAQLTVVFSIAAKSELLLVILWAAILVIFSLWAINGWKKYFEAFVRHEIDSSTKG